MGVGIGVSCANQSHARARFSRRARKVIGGGGPRMVFGFTGALLAIETVHGLPSASIFHCSASCE